MGPDRQSVDAERWPGVARTPAGRIAEAGGRLARRSFGRACDAAGLQVGEDLKIHDDTTFARIAESDWLGFGEGYLADEWDSADLVSTLSSLLETGLEVGSAGRSVKMMRTLGRTKPPQVEPLKGGELPSSLLSLYAGPGQAAGSALFGSGIATTVREEMPSRIPGAGKHGLPPSFPVDVTRVTAPVDPRRSDLAAAQRRRISRMLHAGRVRTGSRVLEWPAAGGAVALAAAEAGAAADVLAGSEDSAASVTERAKAADLSGAVRVLRSRDPVPGPMSFPGRYDAIFCVERLETLGMPGLVAWLRGAERIIADRGTIVVQMALATGSFDDSARHALDLDRSYVWPSLYFPTLTEFQTAVEKETGLRIVAATHFPEHYAKTLEMWHDQFEANSRQAAGLGYDRVYRRLWNYRLGLQQALAETGRLDMVQICMVRPRRRR